MGTAASVPAVGMPVNPRLQYADELAKKDGKAMVIDAPTLMDLGHGTIRYRYVKNTEPEKTEKRTVSKVEDRVEQPHEVEQEENKKLKQGYFYHAKLNDFSEDANTNKEQSHKFKYVFRGPQCARKKKLCYVFGVGTEAKDPGLIQRTSYVANKTQGRGYIWPSAYRKPNHLYYEVIFSEQDGELSGDEDEVDYSTDVEKKPQQQNLLMRVRQADTVIQLKERLSMRLLKPIEQIHIIFENQDLRNDETFKEKRSPLDLDSGSWENIQIQLNVA